MCRGQEHLQEDLTTSWGTSNMIILTDHVNLQYELTEVKKNNQIRFHLPRFRWETGALRCRTESGSSLLFPATTYAQQSYFSKWILRGKYLLSTALLKQRVFSHIILAREPKSMCHLCFGECVFLNNLPDLEWLKQLRTIFMLFLSSSETGQSSLLPTWHLSWV